MRDILNAAYSLLGDGQGDEWHTNPEYTRAIIEMTCTLLGVSTDNRDEVETLIRASA